MHSVDTKSEIVKILHFKQFYKHYVFVEDGEGGRKKVLKNYIDVNVCIDMVCGDISGEKSDIPKDFKQGDFVKLFGQIRTSIDDNGKEHSNVRILSSKLLKAKEQMKGQDKSQEIAKLKSEIEEREKDLFYADSWEQSGQIRVDIEKMKAKLNILINSEKDQENGKKSILGAIKEYQAEDKQKPKESKEKRKETER